MEQEYEKNANLRPFQKRAHADELLCVCSKLSFLIYILLHLIHNYTPEYLTAFLKKCCSVAAKIRRDIRRPCAALLL